MTEGKGGYASEVVPLSAIREICDGLNALALAAGPADREILARAVDVLNLQAGMVRGFEARLAGDMEQVPDRALEGAVLQHFGTEQPYFLSLARNLAHDVRLLCFFQALERTQWAQS